GLRRRTCKRPGSGSKRGESYPANLLAVSEEGRACSVRMTECPPCRPRKATGRSGMPRAALLHLLEVPVVQGECHPAYVFGKKHTGIPVHEEREFGSLGEHL